MNPPSLRAQFEELCALDASERAAVLSGIAKSDPDRAARLHGMLAADADAATETETVLPSIAEALSGSLLEQRRAAFDANGFTPQRLLGRGGMGEVWLVERTVAGRSQSLALKLLQPGQGPSEIWLARFRTEQRILLELDHPGIARLIDAGEVDGQPWIAMEYVDGLDLIEWCDRNNLNIEARLRLFQQICAAVQYAHDRLIVHRDLKPANVMVNHRGEPKLLDFGIAKILDDNDPASFHTGTAQHLFSLYGVTPEQLRGEAPTVGTDVYALGALMYELVSGRQALNFDGLTLTGIEQRVAHESPLLPSQAVEAESARLRGEPDADALAKTLRGDLDRIVLHALRKRSSERYPSAREFSADIERFLTQQPVHAAGQGRAYRAGKFLRRHRLATAVALAVLALIAVFIVQLRFERDAAERARDSAQRVSEFLIKMFELGDPTRSLAREISAAEMLEQGFKQLDEQQLDARSGAPVLLAMARAAQGLGDPVTADIALRALRKVESELETDRRIELGLIALTLAQDRKDAATQRDLLQALKNLPAESFSTSQRDRLELLDIQDQRMRGESQLAIERLRQRRLSRSQPDFQAMKMEARFLHGLRQHQQIEQLLAPACKLLEAEPDKALLLADFLRARAGAAASLQQAEQAEQLLNQATAIVHAKLGPDHLQAHLLKMSRGIIFSALHQKGRAVTAYAELIKDLSPKLPANHALLSALRQNIVIATSEYVEATPSQLTEARKIALAALDDPEQLDYVERYSLALIRLDVLAGATDRALTFVRSLINSPHSGFNPARLTQLEAWEFLLSQRSSTPAMIEDLLRRQTIDDTLLKSRLRARLNAGG